MRNEQVRNGLAVVTGNARDQYVLLGGDKERHVEPFGNEAQCAPQPLAVSDVTHAARTHANTDLKEPSSRVRHPR